MPEPDDPNLAIEKATRFVNIYRRAGKASADVEIAVVLHGDATLFILNNTAYAELFKLCRTIQNLWESQP